LRKFPAVIAEDGRIVARLLIMKMKRPWEVDGDRAIANIRQTKINLAAIFAVFG